MDVKTDRTTRSYTRSLLPLALGWMRWLVFLLEWLADTAGSNGRFCSNGGDGLLAGMANE